MVKFLILSPHSSEDRALPSGGRNPRSSRGGGMNDGVILNALKIFFPQGVFYLNKDIV